jgi:hypothetical protein
MRSKVACHSKCVQKSSRGAQAARSGGSRKPEHTWAYVRIFGGTRDAADWARSRFLDTFSGLGGTVTYFLELG